MTEAIRGRDKLRRNLDDLTTALTIGDMNRANQIILSSYEVATELNLSKQVRERLSSILFNWKSSPEDCSEAVNIIDQLYQEARKA